MKGGRPVGGRRVKPESPDDKPRNVNVSIYESEYRDVRAWAESNGDTPGSAMRDLAVGVARGKITITERKP